MRKLKQPNAITLVALVITIIILLILAGISIQAITNQGLFGRAKEARNKTENVQIEENETLENYLAKINEITGGTSGGNQGGGQESAESSTSTTHTPTNLTDTYSWDEIADMAKVISNTNSIDEDTLEVNVTINNETITLGVGDTATVDGKTVRILGFNHDELASSTAYGTTTATEKAGISFEYVDFIDVDGKGTTKAGMNSSATNSGGWGSSALKSTLNSTTYNNLSIKDKIKQVKKEYIQTYNNAGSKTTSSDYLWLLSCGEIWDNGNNGGVTRGYAIATEGSQYKYYKTTLGSTEYISSTDITKKPNVSSSSYWWLRSPGYGSTRSFCFVYSNGSCGYTYASYSYGVAPGFCI